MQNKDKIFIDYNVYHERNYYQSLDDKQKRILDLPLSKKIKLLNYLSDNRILTFEVGISYFKVLHGLEEFSKIIPDDILNQIERD